MSCRNFNIFCIFKTLQLLKTHSSFLKMQDSQVGISIRCSFFACVVYQYTTRFKRIWEVSHKRITIVLSEWFFYSYFQRVIAALREHARAVVEPSIPQAASVTTHKTSYDTSAVWKKIFAQTLQQRLVPVIGYFLNNYWSNESKSFVRIDVDKREIVWEFNLPTFMSLSNESKYCCRRVDESWQARVYTSAFSTLMSWSIENK